MHRGKETDDGAVLCQSGRGLHGLRWPCVEGRGWSLNISMSQP